MSFVVDSSVALTWCFEEELTPTTLVLLDRVGVSGAIAPVLWPLEVLNGLVLAERHARISREQRQRLASFLKKLPITIERGTIDHAWDMVLLLADQFRLTLYDACFLELAQRRDLPLATLDKDLRRAAGKLGVTLLGR